MRWFLFLFLCWSTPSFSAAEHCGFVASMQVDNQLTRATDEFIGFLQSSKVVDGGRIGLQVYYHTDEIGYRSTVIVARIDEDGYPARFNAWMREVKRHLNSRLELLGDSSAELAEEAAEIDLLVSGRRSAGYTELKVKHARMWGHRVKALVCGALTCAFGASTVASSFQLYDSPSIENLVMTMGSAISTSIFGAGTLISFLSAELERPEVNDKTIYRKFMEIMNDERSQDSLAIILTDHSFSDLGSMLENERDELGNRVFTRDTKAPISSGRRTFH